MNINLTENSYIYQSAKRLLNRELEKCSQLLKKNEEAWNESMNLKLHDAFTANVDFKYNNAEICFSDQAQSDWFETFCNDRYDLFIEWCREMEYDFEELKDPVGRTSSFYLGKLHNNEKDKYLVALYEAVDLNNSWLEFKEVDGVIKLDEKETNKNFEDKAEVILAEFDIEQIVNDMLSLTESIYDDLERVLKPIIDVYNYIKDEKQNQVENFKEYVKEQWISLA